MMERAALRAELYLVLSRAFLAPRQEGHAHALRTLLADDLQDLQCALGLGVDAAVAGVRARMAATRGALELLQVYSALFLVPPVHAAINVGRYLDGALDGGSVRAMEEAYRRAGFARDERFRDLGDHLSLVLEFIAALYQREAAGLQPAVAPGEFLHAFVLPWIGVFRADLSRATCELGPHPYGHLAEVLQCAASADAVAPAVDPVLQRRRAAIEKARARYARRGISDDDVEQMRRKLRARGLADDHVAAAVQALGARRQPAQEAPA